MFIVEICELMLVLKVMLRNWVYCRFRKDFISQEERLDMGIKEFSWVNWEIRHNDSNCLKSRQTGSGFPTFNHFLLQVIQLFVHILYVDHIDFSIPLMLLALVYVWPFSLIH